MKPWKEQSRYSVEAQLRNRKVNITELQVKRDSYQRAFMEASGDDYLLGKILDINRQIQKAKKPILARELHLNQGIRIKK